MWDCIWYDAVIFCVSEFQKKISEFAASIEHSKAKGVSASGRLCPLDPPTRGSAPEPRWGLCPQTPVIGSRSARSPWPPLCQILNTSLETIVSSSLLLQWLNVAARDNQLILHKDVVSRQSIVAPAIARQLYGFTPNVEHATSFSDAADATTKTQG